ncbi:cytochrome c biogenesis CcdA family protein [Thermicanus aegyptius]|uniref:cytochrome c biogenesis CcdA family protein n=1 Tax=Thermicanus aegyptius TaxID=94009 RepID=UPI0004014625|nr:cytochrome c biogenesis protein CcdA [Thermicanus aegyptius]
MSEVTVWLAFSAGIISFLSPCVLPLYPSFLSYISGVSVADLKEGDKTGIRKQVLLHTLFFVTGLSLIYVMMGFGASLIGDLFQTYNGLIRQIGAIFIIMMGLVLIGWLKFDFLMREHRWEIRNKPAGYLGSFFIGFSFAAGWTPCIGPILGSILALGATQPDLALYYTLFYSIGFSIPFILLAFFIGTTRAILKYSNLIAKVGGGLMILMGILLFTDQMSKITIFLTKIFGTSWF